MTTRQPLRARWLLPLAAAVLGTALLSSLLPISPEVEAAERIKTGSPAPDFILPLLSGEEISLYRLKGKPILLTFWAVWCHACAEEMPNLEMVYREHRERGLEVVGVNIDRDPPASIQDYVRKKNISFPILLDREKKAMRAYQAHFLPTTFLIDRKGIVVDRKVGPYNWNSAQGKALIEDLLRR